MAEKKMSTLALLQILSEFSDSQHPLSLKELQQRLENNIDCKLDRRTLYNNLQRLQEMGYNINMYKENGSGYYLEDRLFEEAEVMLLCNAIHASNYIPKRDSRDLIDKLLKTQSRYAASRFRNSVYVDNLRKTENRDFFYNLQILLEAIEEGVCVEFDYMRFNRQKQLVPRRKEKYVLHPYYLVYANDKTYLIARNEKYEGFSHYRLDKIRQIHKTNRKVIPLQKSEDPYQYANHKIYMFGGEEEYFLLRCDDRILDDILDSFGKEVPVVDFDDHHFVTRIQSSRQGMFYFALQYLEYLEILEPADARQHLTQILQQALLRYQKK